MEKTGTNQVFQVSALLRERKEIYKSSASSERMFYNIVLFINLKELYGVAIMVQTT